MTSDHSVYNNSFKIIFNAKNLLLAISMETSFNDDSNKETFN